MLPAVTTHAPTIAAFLPRPPRWEIPWEEIDAAVPWIAAMRACRQGRDPSGEDNVWSHTRRVCEALVRHPDWIRLPDGERFILFTAALMHDVGKPAAPGENDNHARRGAIMTRSILWHMGIPAITREAICAIIEHHGVPFAAWKATDPRPLLIRSSLATRNSLLAIMAKADTLGSIRSNRDATLEEIDLFKEICLDSRCLNHPCVFTSDEARLAYFAAPANRNPEIFTTKPSKGATVTLLSSLSRRASLSWVHANGGKLPVVSTEAIRPTIKLKVIEEIDARVSQIAYALAREHLRVNRDFIWDDRHLSRESRRKVLSLAREHNARVRIVVIEASPKTVQGELAGDIDNALNRLTAKWEMPDLTEAHEIVHALAA